MVRLAIDGYNAGLQAPANGNSQDPPATRFVVHEIESNGDLVITSGELIDAGDARKSPRSRLTLIWLFDPVGRVADVRVLASG